jgi:hypothetical protein
MVKKRQAPSYVQALYDALVLRSRRDFSAYETPRPWPVREVPGELAFFLDDLVQHAGILDGRKPDEVVAEVIDLGIVAWYAKLSRKARAKLGLPGLVAQEAAEAGQPAEHAKKVPAVIVSGVLRLRAVAEALRAELAELRSTAGGRGLRDHEIGDGQSAFLESPDKSSGYIMLTAHETPVVRTAPGVSNPKKKPQPRHKKRRKAHK